MGSQPLQSVVNSWLGIGRIRGASIATHGGKTRLIGTGAWKACFNINWQEVVQSDSATDEIHIADVKTPKGVVLEFQNSPMDLQEMRSRESFYRNMVWIVNASSFHKHLEIGKVRLPPPSAPFLSDVLLAAPVGVFQAINLHAGYEPAASPSDGGFSRKLMRIT